MRERRWTRTTIGTIIGIVLLWCVGAPGMVSAQDDVELLKQRLEQMSQEMEAVQKKLEDIERKSEAKEEEIEEMDDRLNKAELHTATDKVAFGIEFRTRGDSLHYKDIQMAPSALVGSFFADYATTPNGFNGATLAEIQQRIGQFAMAGMIPPTEKYDADNDIILTNKFRLSMKAKVNDQLSFDGRLAAYKVFSDSTGVKFNQGSLGDVTLDGNTSSLPHGDTIRLERAYFNYMKDWGRVPTNFSLGRRPGTDGPPMSTLR